MTAFKEVGGITLAQYHTAQLTGMPHSAITEGSVDSVLAPHEIAQEPVRIARQPVMPQPAPVSGTDAEGELQRVLKAVRHAAGVDFAHQKINTLQRRITRRMIQRRTSSLD